MATRKRNREDEVDKARARRKIVRQLLVEGVGEHAIRRMLLDGYKDAATGVAIEKCSHPGVEKAMREVAAEFQGLFDDEAAVEREIGSSFDRLKRIALAAEANKRFTSAITANLQIIRLLAPRSKRWQHVINGERPLAGGGAAAQPVADVGAVEAQELEPLVRENAELDRHVARLEVLQGGAAKAKG